MSLCVSVEVDSPSVVDICIAANFCKSANEPAASKWGRSKNSQMENPQDLILIRRNLMEIYSINKNNEMVLVTTLKLGSPPLHAQVFKRNDQETDILFLLMSDTQISACRYDPEFNSIRTVSLHSFSKCDSSLLDEKSFGFLRVDHSNNILYAKLSNTHFASMAFNFSRQFFLDSQQERVDSTCEGDHIMLDNVGELISCFTSSLSTTLNAKELKDASIVPSVSRPTVVLLLGVSNLSSTNILLDTQVEAHIAHGDHAQNALKDLQSFKQIGSGNNIHQEHNENTSTINCLNNALVIATVDFLRQKLIVVRRISCVPFDAFRVFASPFGRRMIVMGGSYVMCFSGVMGSRHSILYQALNIVALEKEGEEIRERRGEKGEEGRHSVHYLDLNSGGGDMNVKLQMKVLSFMCNVDFGSNETSVVKIEDLENKEEEGEKMEERGERVITPVLGNAVICERDGRVFVIDRMGRGITYCDYDDEKIFENRDMKWNYVPTLRWKKGMEGDKAGKAVEGLNHALFCTTACLVDVHGGQSHLFFGGISPIPPCLVSLSSLIDVFSFSGKVFSARGREKLLGKDGGESSRQVIRSLLSQHIDKDELNRAAAMSLAPPALETHETKGVLNIISSILDLSVNAPVTVEKIEKVEREKSEKRRMSVLGDKENYNYSLNEFLGDRRTSKKCLQQKIGVVVWELEPWRTLINDVVPLHYNSSQFSGYSAEDRQRVLEEKELNTKIYKDLLLASTGIPFDLTPGMNVEGEEQENKEEKMEIVEETGGMDIGEAVVEEVGEEGEEGEEEGEIIEEENVDSEKTANVSRLRALTVLRKHVPLDIQAAFNLPDMALSWNLKCAHEQRVDYIERQEGKIEREDRGEKGEKRDRSGQAFDQHQTSLIADETIAHCRCQEDLEFLMFSSHAHLQQNSSKASDRVKTYMLKVNPLEDAIDEVELSQMTSPPVLWDTETIGAGTLFLSQRAIPICVGVQVHAKGIQIFRLQSTMSSLLSTISFSPLFLESEDNIYAVNAIVQHPHVIVHFNNGTVLSWVVSSKANEVLSLHGKDRDGKILPKCAHDHATSISLYHSLKKQTPQNLLVGISWQPPKSRWEPESNWCMWIIDLDNNGELLFENHVIACCSAMLRSCHKGESKDVALHLGDSFRCITDICEPPSHERAGEVVPPLRGMDDWSMHQKCTEYASDLGMSPPSFATSLVTSPNTAFVFGAVLVDISANSPPVLTVHIRNRAVLLYEAYECQKYEESHPAFPYRFKLNTTGPISPVSPCSTYFGAPRVNLNQLPVIPGAEMPKTVKVGANKKGDALVLVLPPAICAGKKFEDAVAVCGFENAGGCAVASPFWVMWGEGRLRTHGYVLSTSSMDESGVCISPPALPIAVGGEAGGKGSMVMIENKTVPIEMAPYFSVSTAVEMPKTQSFALSAVNVCMKRCQNGVCIVSGDGTISIATFPSLLPWQMPSEDYVPAVELRTSLPACPVAVSPSCLPGFSFGKTIDVVSKVAINPSCTHLAVALTSKAKVPEMLKRRGDRKGSKADGLEGKGIEGDERERKREIVMVFSISFSAEAYSAYNDVEQIYSWEREKGTQEDDADVGEPVEEEEDIQMVEEKEAKDNNRAPLYIDIKNIQECQQSQGGIFPEHDMSNSETQHGASNELYAASPKDEEFIFQEYWKSIPSADYAAENEMSAMSINPKADGTVGGVAGGEGREGREGREGADETGDVSMGESEDKNNYVPPSNDTDCFILLEKLEGVYTFDECEKIFSLDFAHESDDTKVVVGVGRKEKLGQGCSEPPLFVGGSLRILGIDRLNYPTSPVSPISPVSPSSPYSEPEIYEGGSETIVDHRNPAMPQLIVLMDRSFARGPVTYAVPFDIKKNPAAFQPPPPPPMGGAYPGTSYGASAGGREQFVLHNNGSEVLIQQIENNKVIGGAFHILSSVSTCSAIVRSKKSAYVIVADGTHGLQVLQWRTDTINGSRRLEERMRTAPLDRFSITQCEGIVLGKSLGVISSDVNGDIILFGTPSAEGESLRLIGQLGGVGIANKFLRLQSGSSQYSVMCAMRNGSMRWITPFNNRLQLALSTVASLAYDQPSPLGIVNRPRKGDALLDSSHFTLTSFLAAPLLLSSLVELDLSMPELVSLFSYVSN